ncbi:MAG: DNA-3-methyladenine glycosylase I [Chloroflexi bacterium]|nr:DNA-3-methyladenine glycosylase I [Chloroflexota bacterium]
MPASPTRCEWAGDDPLMQQYHDEEWGVPLHEDRALFELLVLEGAQAGLSWRTVLHRREGYRAAFDGFDVATVAAYGDAQRERLRADARIIRNRAKIDAAIANARATLAVQAEHGSLDAFLWSFVGGGPRRDAFAALGDIPAQTEQSRAMSKALKEYGYSFVGPTICYAFMQSAGLVNDHVASCFRYEQVTGA